MNEFELIRLLTAGLPPHEKVVQGVGDDCAVLDLGLADRWLLLKTDAVVEGIHFDKGASPERVGHKALGRCLSDIAAMAGEASFALITLALPRDFDPAYVQGLYRGMQALGTQHGVAIVGGETTTNPERLLLSVTVAGFVTKDRCVLRSGAKPGDAMFVTGELGGSLEGRHLDFEPRLTEARWLAAHFSVHSMMDLSDGLAGDLRHLLEAGRVGAELLAAAVPISRAARRRARLPIATDPGAPPRRQPLEAALSDGEDFELLFTVSARDAVPLLDAWKTAFPKVRLTCLGRISQEPGLRLRHKDCVQTLALHGYAHFD